MKKVRVYNFESREMWIADGYDELSELFMALNTDDSMFSEPMQSTGLLDVNGKEIFEGDVISVIGELHTVFYDTKKGSFRLNPHDKRWNVDYMSNYAHIDSFEIIGNIYETQELAKEIEE